MHPYRNLQRRSNGVYYLRIFVPTDLIKRFGRKELTRSLKTRDFHRAKFLARLLRVQTQSLMSMARQNPKLSAEELLALAKRYFDWNLDQAEGDRLAERIKAGELEFVLDQHAENIEDLNDWIRHNKLVQAGPALDAFLKREHLQIEKSSHDYLKLSNYILRAQRDTEEILRERALGNFDAKPTNALFKDISKDNSVASAQEQTETESFGSLTAKWYEDLEQTWRPKTRAKYAGNMKVWRELLGENTQVAQITKPMVREARDQLRNLPRKWSWTHPNKSIAEIVDSNDDQDIHQLSPGTIQAYLGTLSSFFGWAEREGYLNASPANRLSVPDPVKAKDKRDPFQTEHLTMILKAPIYTGMRSKHYWKEPGTTVKKDHRYWSPLIGLYSGMRLGEIFGLKKEDWMSVDGVKVMSIRRAKTEAGERMVPVHPFLIAIGLGDYVDELQTVSQLFSDTNEKAYSKHFGRFLDSLKITDSKLVFHSLRHTFIDALRAARIEEPMIQSIVGQSTGSVTSQYGSGYPANVLHDAIAQVEYSGLDVSHLNAESSSAEV